MAGDVTNEQLEQLAFEAIEHRLRAFPTSPGSLRDLILHRDRALLKLLSAMYFDGVRAGSTLTAEMIVNVESDREISNQNADTL